MPVNHKAIGLSSTNGNGLGHRSKHRVQGRQNGFYTDNGEYSTPAAARGAEPAAFFAAPSSVESNLAWKFENDSFHVGSGAAVLSPVFNGSRSIDYRVKDVGDWHTQDPYVSPPVNGRDSSVMIDQRFRPFHVHGFVESDRCLVDQECSKLVSGSANNLELSHRTSRDHRDRQQSKSDLYSRKRGAFGHFDSGKDWISSDKEDGSRLDRYGTSSHENIFRDSQGGSNDSGHTHEWQSRGTSTLRGSLFGAGNGMIRNVGVRAHVLDSRTSSLLSPQHLSHSTSPSARLEPVCDEVDLPSPPKRPRLGWGQGLAKYEKKKVGDSDESPSPAAVSTHVEGEPSALPSTENGVDGWIAGDVSGSDARVSSPCCHSPANTSVVSVVSPSNQQVDNTLQIAEIAVSSQKTETGYCLATGLPACEQPVIEEQRVVCEDVLSDEGGLVGWTKHAILQRVEKLEFEIDQVEKEIGKIEINEVGNDLHDLVTIDEEIPAVHSSERDEDCLMAMDEDLQEVSTVVDNGRDAVVTPSLPSFETPSAADISPKRPVLLADECPWNSSPHLEIRRDSPDVSQPQLMHPSEEGELGVHILQESKSRVDLEEFDSRDMKLEMRHETGEPFLCGQVMDSQPNLLGKNFADLLILKNQEQAQQAFEPFMHLLLPELLVKGCSPLYCCPTDAPAWQQNVESHNRNSQLILQKLTERWQCLKFKERVLTMRFRALKEFWRQGQQDLCKRRDFSKAAHRWEPERRNGCGPPSQRTSLRLRPMHTSMFLTGIGSLIVLCFTFYPYAMRKMMSEPPVEHLRSTLKMPAMILDEKERMSRRFLNSNALVEDPISLEHERVGINPWSIEEKKCFFEKFAMYNKNFSKIASHLEHKTTADCVEFYYRNQKSEDFQKIQRRHQLKKRRDYSRSNSSYLATTTPASSRHREAHAARVEALTLAASSATAAVTVGTKAVRSTNHHKVLDRGRGGTCSNDFSSLPAQSDSSKCVGSKESKIAACNLLAVAAGSPLAVSTSCMETPPCTLSSAVTPPTKLCRERTFVKKSVSGGPSIIRGCQLDQQTAGQKGIRSLHLRREASKSAAEEVCSMSQLLILMAHMMHSQWTDGERQVFTDAVALFGKDFRSIALLVRSKSQVQCRAFFSKSRKRLGLDHLVEQFHATMHARVEAATLSAQNSKHAYVVKPEVAEDVKLLPTALVTDCQSQEEKIETKQGGDNANVIVAGVVKTAKDLSQAGRTKWTCEPWKDASKNLVEELSDLDLVAAAAEMLVKSAVDIPQTSFGAQEATNLEAPSTSGLAADSELDRHVPPSCDDVPSTLDMTEASSIADAQICQEDEEETAAAKGDGGSPIGVSPAIEREAAVVDQAAAALVGISAMLLDKQDMKIMNPVTELKPGPFPAGLLANTERTACPSPVVPATEWTISGVTSTRPATHNSAQQTKEKVSRSGTGGEVKPRREPTSWTQDEKETFAEILRNHGKDWRLLHESLPSKSLTQIKTYFQNSKAKLGFPTTEGMGNTGGKGGGTRKRKAEDSDTNSNNAGSGGPLYHQKFSSVSPSEVDITSHQAKPGMGAPLSMGAKVAMGPAAVGTNNEYATLLGSLSGQPVDQENLNISDIQKLIRQIVHANSCPPSSQPGGFSMFQSGVMPGSSFQGNQRVSHLRSQQQLVQPAAQKPSPMGTHQMQSLTPDIVLQNNQPVLHQAVHQLQQQQQQPLQIPALNMVQQQAAHQQQQQQSQSPQLVLPSSAVPLQQQQLQQVVQQQQCDETQAAIAQVQTFMHFQHQHLQQPSLLHPQSILTAKPHPTIVAQPQILKPQASVSTQQPGLLHFQELPSLAVLRGAQNSTANGTTEVQSHQTGMMELRGGCNNVSAANNMHQVAHNEQQQPGAVQQPPVQPQGPSQRSALPSCDDVQHVGLSDVKLFGKSLLSQPNLMASGVPSLSASSNGRVTLQQPAFSNISIPAASIGTRGALSKVYGTDSVALPSAFGRVGGPYMAAEGRQAVRPRLTTAQPGNLGLWKRVSNLQSPGPIKGKPEEATSHAMEQPAQAQEAQKFEVEQVTAAHPHRVRGGHELCRSDGAQMLDQGKGAAAMAEQYVVGQVNQVDFDTCIEPSQGMASGVDQSSLSGWSSSNRGESEFGNSQGSSSMPNKGLPRFVVEALMAIADWQSSQSTPSHCSTGGVQQQLEDLQSWQGAFQRDMIGAMTDPVKVSMALELAASLTGQVQLSALDMLQQSPREGGMYTSPQSVFNLPGHAAWSNSGFEQQQRSVVVPTVTSFHSSNLSRVSGTEEIARTAELRDPDSASGGVC
ncbi:unnamed protein product [Sphagnum jensenii]|uniref:Nuclear receptor corepressor 1 n=1 Tax=Sphagnum jensenii TaxID=128206 RepID=A0ABP0X7S3_9BRYO